MNLKIFFLLSCIIFLFGCKKHEDDIPVKPLESKVPKLSTKPISDLTHFSVILGGSVIDTVGSKLTDQGIVVGTSSLPTLSDNFNKFSMTADSNGNFSALILNIPPNVTYYLRAYGINAQGTGYGNEISFTSLNEKAFKGNVTINTQQELIEFGANNYTTIKGGLIIKGSVTDLTPLSSLVIIGNEFEVIETSLVDFKGLENLEIVGIDIANVVRIENNQSLKSFLGLKKLKSTFGSFYILNNDALLNLDGLDSYTNCIYGQVFYIKDCDNLESLAGLESMEFIQGSLYLYNNLSLKNLTALRNLKTITESIYVINNKSLTNIDGFENIKQLVGIDLTDNKLLSDLKGLSNLTSTESITISNNDSLKDLSAFTNLTSINYLFVNTNKSLTNLKGFDKLEHIGRIEIYFNHNLINLTGLEKVRSIIFAEIIENNSLINLTGLNGLTKINSFSLGGNSKLQSISGIENLVQADGNISIWMNSTLSDFCALKLLFNTGFSNYTISENLTNPTSAEIITNCP